MKIITRTISIALFAAALPAFAQVGAGLGGNVDAQVNGGEAQVQAQAQAQAEAQAEQDAATQNQNQAQVEGIQVEASGPVDVQVQSRGPAAAAEIENRAEVQVQTADAQAGVSNTTRARVRIDGEAITVDPNAQGSINTPQSVNTEEELSIYADTIAQGNNRVESVEISDQEVTLTFRDEAKLFGFINVGVNRTVGLKAAQDTQADTKVQTHVSGPWWSFLVSGNAQAKHNLKSELSDRITANTSVDDHPRAQALVMSDVTDVINQYFFAKSQAESEAAVSAN